MRLIVFLALCVATLVVSCTSFANATSHTVANASTNIRRLQEKHSDEEERGLSFKSWFRGAPTINSMNAQELEKEINKGKDSLKKVLDDHSIDVPKLLSTHENEDAMRALVLAMRHMKNKQSKGKRLLKFLVAAFGAYAVVYMIIDLMHHDKKDAASNVGTTTPLPSA